MYTVTSRKGNVYVSEIMEDHELHLSENTENKAVFETDDAVEFELFVDLVMGNAIIIALEEALFDYRPHWTDDEMTAWTRQKGHDYFRDPYFIHTVRHLVRRQLNESQELCLEDFVEFRLRGIKSDAKRLLDLLDMEISPEENAEIPSEEDEINGFSELVEKFAAARIAMQDKKRIDRFHLTLQDGVHRAYAEGPDGLEEVTDDWLSERFGEMRLTIHMDDGTEIDDPIYVLPVLLLVFGVVSLRFHAQTVERSEEFHQVASETGLFEYTIMFCEGCPLCQ